jgi:nitroreductase
LGRVLECVRLAPSASNKQPWRIAYTQAARRGTVVRDHLRRVDSSAWLLGILTLRFSKKEVLR